MDYFTHVKKKFKGKEIDGGKKHVREGKVLACRLKD